MKKNGKKTTRTLAVKYAYWNKWCPGGDPNKVIRSKGITKDEWYITDITNPTPENVGNVTPPGLDNTITKVVKQHYDKAKDKDTRGYPPYSGIASLKCGGKAP